MTHLTTERRASLTEHREFVRGRIAALRAETNAARRNGVDDERTRIREKAFYTYRWRLTQLDRELDACE